MTYMVKFDESPVPDLRSLILSVAGTREGVNQLWDDDFFNSGAVRFVITDDAGNEVVEGAFNGPERDRDVPLMIARIHARDKINPSHIQYDDGISYTINEEWDFAVREE